MRYTTDVPAMKPAAARKMIRKIIETGAVVVTDHAEERMAERNMLLTDVMSVLRGGMPQAPEWENDAWRYRVETALMTVVVEIEVITCWRHDG